MILSFTAILWLSMIFLVLMLVHFFMANDELPLILHLLFLTNALYRYVAVVINKKSFFVVVNYKRNFFTLNDDLALTALNYFFMGNCILICSYLLFRKVFKVKKPLAIHDSLFVKFIATKRFFILGLFLFFLVISFYSTIALSALVYDKGTINISQGVSYFYYAPFALGGLILLMFLVYKNISYQRDGLAKISFGGLILFSAFTSYNPVARFSFLSWIVALGVIFVKDRSARFKANIFLWGGIGIIIFYSYAGLKRTPGALTKPLGRQYEMAMDRLKKAEDQNLLDGFMMVLQVYPDQLNYQYGFQHLEILLRPIPRKIWPNKPKGGYANKLDLNHEENQGTVGISESIYGTFYGEGGFYAIIIGSFLYGIFFARIIRASQGYTGDIAALIKGMTLASILAIIRGGDLAGIAAFVGMSYWPVFIVLRQYTNFVKRFNIWYNRQYLAMKNIAKANERNQKVLEAEALAE